MTAVLLQPTEHWWKCPSCGLTDHTTRTDVHTQMHACPALGGINLPLIEVTDPDAMVDARHVLIERDDYIANSGADRFASVQTQHGNGRIDCTVIAPTARIAIQSLDT